MRRSTTASYYIKIDRFITNQTSERIAALLDIALLDIVIIIIIFYFYFTTFASKTLGGGHVHITMKETQPSQKCLIQVLS